MMGVNIAIAVDDLRMEFRKALDAVRHMGVRNVDVGAVRGPVSRGELSKSGERHLIRHLADLGLRLESLRGPSSGAGYSDGAAGERRLETMRGVIELASALGVPVVSTTLGGPAKDGGGLQEALEVIADHADRHGVTVAIETSAISGGELNDLLRAVNCPFIAACCDSGAMLMQGEDPHRIADVLSGRVRLARVRDATLGSTGASGHETAMGSGQLDPAAMLSGLMEAGYGGPLILTRTSGENPARDLLAAKEIFESFVRRA